MDTFVGKVSREERVTGIGITMDTDDVGSIVIVCSENAGGSYYIQKGWTCSQPPYGIASEVFDCLWRLVPHVCLAVNVCAAGLLVQARLEEYCFGLSKDEHVCLYQEFVGKSGVCWTAEQQRVSEETLTFFADTHPCLPPALITVEYRLAYNLAMRACVQMREYWMGAGSWQERAKKESCYGTFY